MWEQYVNTNPEAKADSLWRYNEVGEALYQTRYTVALDTAGGIPCQEQELKIGLHKMKHPESGEELEFKSMVTYVRLYNK
jgi:hypothetical protein